MNLLLILCTLTTTLLAQTYNGDGAVDLVGGGFMGFIGLPGLDGMISSIFASSRPVIYSIAILVVAVSGVEMVASQSDDSTAKARRTFIGAVVGLIVLILAQVIRNAILNIGSGGAGAGQILSDEIIGVVDFLTAIAGVLIILMIVINGIRAILQFGSGESLSILRSSIIHIIIGVIIISIRWMVVDSITTGDPSPFVNELIRYVNNILIFVGTIAVLVIIYAGIMMIISSGNEDQFGKSRSLIVRAIIGILIILLSSAFVNAIFAGV